MISKYGIPSKNELTVKRTRQTMPSKAKGKDAFFMNLARIKKRAEPSKIDRLIG